MIRVILMGMVVFTSLSWSARIEYQSGGGIWGQVDRYIDDNQALIESNPLSNTSIGSFTLNRDASTDYSYAIGYVNASVGWDYENGSISLIMLSESRAESTDPTSELWAYGDMNTLIPAETSGHFFKVAPDIGETEGTPIRIHLHWYAQCGGISGDASASVGMFEDNVIYVTRNVQPPVNSAPTNGVVWTKIGGHFYEATGQDETASFVVNIGDTIGVFMGIHTRADLSGEGISSTDLMMGMELQAGETVPAMAEYPYAPGLVYDPDQNITFLKDWSAFPDMMSWSDANNAVQDFTYTSGNVTYSDWRLPNTIEGSGMIGELGYLSEQYNISEQFFGPFENVLDGDYWTSPQFGSEPYIFAYIYTYSTTYGPSQYWSPTGYACYTVPVFDGPPREYWCPADFDSDGIVDLSDFATFASYWLNERD
jgi:hypothetical protein